MSATWDTYTYQLDSYGNPVRVNKPRWTVGKGLGRLSSTGTSFSYTFNNDTFKKKDKKKNDNKQPQPQPNTLPPDPNEEPEDNGPRKNRTHNSGPTVMRFGRSRGVYLSTIRSITDMGLSTKRKWNTTAGLPKT